MLIDETEYKTGESAPIGTYVCSSCIGNNGFYPEITEEEQVLPKCPYCGDTVWNLIRIDS